MGFIPWQASQIMLLPRRLFPAGTIVSVRVLRLFARVQLLDQLLPCPSQVTGGDFAFHQNTYLGWTLVTLHVTAVSVACLFPDFQISLRICDNL